MVESYWAIPDVAEVRTPLSILREQATALTEETRGLLVGFVDVQPGDHRILDFQRRPKVRNKLLGQPGVEVRKELEARLDINVPAMSNYRFRFLIYEQPMNIYPGLLSGIGIPAYVEIFDEQAFQQAVRTALSSKEAKDVLAQLMSQALAA